MNRFDKIFARYKQTASERKLLDLATDIVHRVDIEHRMVEADVSFPQIIPKDSLYEIEEKIREAYDLNVVRLLPHYNKELWDLSYVPEVMRELNRVGAVSRGFFN